jgi:4-amino-4-deoxy-L-arabinose transferase-like glycosyltransferase
MCQNENKISTKKVTQVCAALVVFFLCTFLLFYKLSEAPIQIWDEAIYANNAVEMLVDGELLVLKRDGEPTLYNTKPPLVIWLQALCLSIFGANEFAIRLPSALAGVFTFGALLIFAFRILKKPIIGIIACLVLASTTGYITPHVVRTGDLDAILTLFITLFTLSVFAFLLRRDGKVESYISWAGVFVLLACFTKSVAAFLPLPGLLICLLVGKKAKIIFKNRQLYLVAFSGIFIIFAYYYLRESMLSGYWDKVFLSEFSRMHKDIMPYHNQTWNYYLVQMIWNERFFPFVFAVPFAVVFSYFQTNKLLKYFSIYGAIWAAIYLFIISIPTVKLWWYSAPLYPILSLLLGVLFSQFLSLFKGTYFSKLTIASIAILLLFYLPLQNVLSKIEKDSKQVEWQELPGMYIRKLKKENSAFKKYKVILQVKEEEHIDAANFYVRAYNHFEDYQISLETNPENMIVGDIVMLCWDTERDIMKRKFEFKNLTQDKECGLYALIANK